VVGEVRGAEVVDLLAAMNTGHEGGCGTVHANSPSDVPARIETLALLAGLPRAAAHSLLGAAVDVVIHLDRPRHGDRRLAEVGVLEASGGAVEVVNAISCAEDLNARRGPGWRRFQELLAG
jgi:pilus assembly protein CpaF